MTQLHAVGEHQNNRSERELSVLARFYRLGQSSGNRQEFLSAQLTNWNETLNAYFPSVKGREADRLHDGCALFVQGRRFLHARCGDSLVVDRWELIDEEREADNALLLIPSAVCPKPALVEQLVTTIERLTVRSLKAFIAYVVTSPDIQNQYLTAKASHHAHHNWLSGLLEHSLEMAAWVAQFDALSPTQREIGTVVALIHDIGKVRTHGSAVAQSDINALLGHEARALKILSPLLAQLEAEWPDGA